MRMAVGSMVAMSATFVWGMWESATPNAEGMIQRPRTQVYASLDRLYSEVEHRSRKVTTVTGKPPLPVIFSFDREDGKMLSMTAKAGMRTVRLQTWLEDGPEPDQTRIKVLFQPESLRSKAGAGDLASAVETILWRTEAQMQEGQRITALFGGSPARRSSGPGRRDYAVRVDPTSDAPRVTPNPSAESAP